MNQQDIYTLFKQTSQQNCLVTHEMFPIALGCICSGHLSNTECFKVFEVPGLDICLHWSIKLVLDLNTVKARKNSMSESLQSQEKCTGKTKTSSF